MKWEIRESGNSTPERPLWVWRVWHDGREVNMGFCSSREEAERAVEASCRRLGPRPGWWLDYSEGV